MKKINLSQRFFLNSFFALALILILITTYFSYHQIKKVIASHEWVKHTYTVMENSQSVLLKIQEVEAEVRGYWILGDESWIKDIDEDLEEITTSIALLKKSTIDNELQQTLIKKLEPIVEDRIAMLKRVVQLKLENKSQDQEAVKGFVQKGYVLTLKIQEIIRDIYQNEGMLMRERDAAFRLNLNLINVISHSIYFTILCLLLGTIVFFNKVFSTLMRTQEKAIQSKSLLQGIIGGSKEYIAAIDLNYNFLAYNNAFEEEFHRLFGKRVRIGANIKSLLDHMPVEQEKVVKIWSRALNGEEFTIIERFGSDAHSQIQYEITYSSLFNDQGQLIGASVIARDVERRLREEANLKEYSEKLKNTFNQVEAQAQEMQLLNNMSNILQSSSTLDEALNMSSLYLRKIFPFASGIIYLFNHSRNFLEATTEWNQPLASEKIFSPDQCWGLRQGKTYFFISKEENLPCKHNFQENHLSSYFCVPMLAANDLIGLLYLKITDSSKMSKEEILQLYEKNQVLVQNVASQISLSISNVRLNELLKTRSTRDLLTNLYNRSYLDDTFERELRRAKRKNASMAIVMMDLDFFKNVNDTYGHEVGDLVLREVTKLIVLQQRESDIACRFGGEEILLIMYDIELEDAKEKIEELRQNIANIEFQYIHTLKITASFGLAMFPADADNSSDLIKAADTALYHSKNTGRNRITVYREINKN